MISQTLVNEIVQLLEEGRLSRRAIAVRLGVSPTSVCSIANGSRGRHGSQASIDRPGEPRIARCSSCGAKVFLPCVACQARLYRQRQRSMSSSLRQQHLEALPAEPCDWQVA